MSVVALVRNEPPPAASPLPVPVSRACELLVEGVRYRYPNKREAIAGIDLNLRPGVLGLLGPNGAGKSTLMRILATLARPSAGRVLWNGVDVARKPNVLRASLGYLPQDFGIYPALSAREFLAYLGAVKGIPSATMAARIDACLAEVGLSDAADRRLGDFSGGMRQRVGIAQALLNDPQLLIVDEPTVGLDPEERQRFRHLITDLAGDRLIILSTHIVSDVEASATSLAVMAAGELLFHGTSGELIEQARHSAWEWLVAEADVPAVRAGYTISHSSRRSDGVLMRVIAPTAPAADARAVAPSLEDAYVCLLGRQGTP
jgi:ABC-2 type transport system ATP-binding protein